MAKRNCSKTAAPSKTAHSALFFPFPIRPKCPPRNAKVTIHDNNAAWNDGFAAGLNCMVGLQKHLQKKDPL